MNLLKGIYKTEDRTKIFNNIFWGLAEKTILLISGVFVYARVASYLGTEVFGNFNYILSIYNIFLPLASLGLSNIVVAKLLERGANQEKLMGTAAIMRACGALFAIIANVLFVWLMEGNVNYIYLSFLMSWSYIFSLFLPIDEYFQAQLKSKSISIIRIIVYSILIVLKLGAVYYHAGLEVFLFIYSLEFMLIVLGSIILYLKEGNRFQKWKFDLKVAKILSNAMLPILITLVADTFYAKYAVVVIKQTMDFTEVGVYSVAAKLGEIWYFIPVIICIALFPKITKVYNDNRKYYEEIVSNVYSILFIVSLLVSAFAIVLVEPFVNIFFDASYLDSVPIFQVYVFIGIFIALKTLNQRIYILENIQKYLVVFSVLSSIISVVLFYILIPRYGGIGAAIAIIVSQIFYIFINPLFFKKARTQVKYIIKGILPWNYLKVKSLFLKRQ